MDDESRNHQTAVIASGIHDKVESVVQATRQLEAALRRERERADQSVAQLHQLQEQNQRERATTEQRLRALISDRSILTGRNQVQQQRLEAVDGQIAKQGAVFDRFTHEIKRLQDGLSAQHVVMEGLAKEVSRSQDGQRQMVEQLRQVQANCAGLRASIESSTETGARSEQSLKAGTAEMNAKLEEITRQFQAIDQRVTERLQHDSWSAPLQRLGAEHAQLRAQLQGIFSRLSGTMQTHQEAFKSLRVQVQDTKTNMSDAFRRLSDALAEIQTALRGLTEEVRELKQRPLMEVRTAYEAPPPELPPLPPPAPVVAAPAPAVEPPVTKISAQAEALIERAIQDSQTAVARAEDERRRGRQKEEELKAEIHRLRSVYPLKDLLAKKESEMSRLKLKLGQISKSSTEYQNVEAVLESLVHQADHLRALVNQADAPA